MAGITSFRKGQGATEYLVIMSVVLGIALICVALLVWPTGTTKDVKQSQSDVKNKIQVIGNQWLIDDLKGYWKFDENSGTTANGFRGTATGSLNSGASWTAGKSGYAVLFDGNTGWVSFSNEDNFDINNNSMTVAFWIKLTSAVAGNTGYPVGKYSSPNTAIWKTYLSNGALSASVYDDAGAGASASCGTLSDTNWHHITFTFDTGKTISCYKDGAFVASGTNANMVQQNGGVPLILGCRYSYTGAGNCFDGAIDDLHIYNRALTANEMMELYSYPGSP